MMINLKLATSAGKKNVFVRGNQTPTEVLTENHVATAGATISLNMRPLQASELTETFEALGCKDGDEAMLAAVVKADSAFCA